MQHVAGAAFRAILQNIQALELSFATKAVECFRNAGEGQLNYDKTMQALGTLDLTDFLGEMREGQGTAAGEVNPGVLLGSGSEYRRLWTLWSENRCADEQCFLFIAWRAHRFSEPSFVKEIAMPLFQILDHNGDQLITAEELEEAIMSEDPQKQLTEEARADAKKLRSELKELLLYHCDAAAPNESKGVDFPAFLAFICDAQDKCAMRRYTSKGPVECMARYHKGVVFLRPVNVAECAQPQEQEELEELMSSPAVEALREARASQARAEAALKEARTAKEAAEEAKKGGRPARHPRREAAGEKRTEFQRSGSSCGSACQGFSTSSTIHGFGAEHQARHNAPAGATSAPNRDDRGGADRGFTVQGHLLHVSLSPFGEAGGQQASGDHQAIRGCSLPHVPGADSL